MVPARHSACSLIAPAVSNTTPKSQFVVEGAKTRGAASCPGLDVITSALGDDKLLVSSNDSRMRVYRMKDKELECKYAGGFLNTSSQIKGVFSKDDGCFVLTASEDGFLTVFSGGSPSGEHKRKGFLGHIQECWRWQE